MPFYFTCFYCFLNPHQHTVMHHTTTFLPNYHTTPLPFPLQSLESVVSQTMGIFGACSLDLGPWWRGQYMTFQIRISGIQGRESCECWYIITCFFYYITTVTIRLCKQLWELEDEAIGVKTQNVLGICGKNMLS